MFSEASLRLAMVFSHRILKKTWNFDEIKSGKLSPAGLHVVRIGVPVFAGLVPRCFP
jgi:hypothetical protein